MLPPQKHNFGAPLKNRQKATIKVAKSHEKFLDEAFFYSLFKSEYEFSLKHAKNNMQLNMFLQKAKFIKLWNDNAMSGPFLTFVAAKSSKIKVLFFF